MRIVVETLYELSKIPHITIHSADQSISIHDSDYDADGGFRVQLPLDIAEQLVQELDAAVAEAKKARGDL